MSVKHLGIISIGGFLIFATTPVARAQHDLPGKSGTTQSDKATQGTTNRQSTEGTYGKSTNTNNRNEQSSTNTKSPSSTSAQSSNKEDNKSSADHKTATANQPKSASHAKSSGMSKQVREVQTALKQQGFDPGAADGVMGPMTMTALRNFQSHSKLEVTGKIDSQTQAALGVQGNGTASGVSQNNQSIQNQTSDLSQNQNSQIGQNREKPADTQTDQSLKSDQTDQSSLSTSQDSSKVDQNARLKGDVTADTQQDRIDQSTQSSQNQSSQDKDTADVDHNARLKGDVTADTQQDRIDQSTQSSQNQPSQDKDTADVDHNARLKGDVTADSGNQSTQNSQNQASSQNRSQADRATSQDRGRADEHHATTDNKDKDLARTDTDRDSGKVHKDALDRAEKAAEVLQDLTAGADKRVPNELLSRAEAVVVIPHMIKGAFGLGGRYGKGLVSQRLASGRWSTPAFIQIGGGSFGAQIGVSSTDLVLVFTDAKAMDMLAGGKDLKLGVDAGVVAGPIGRSAEAGVNAKLDSAIYAYSRSKGLFAGVALDGAVLDIDNSENKDVFGDSSAKQLLSGTMANPTVRPFMDALEKVMPKKNQR